MLQQHLLFNSCKLSMPCAIVLRCADFQKDQPVFLKTNWYYLYPNEKIHFPCKCQPAFF